MPAELRIEHPPCTFPFPTNRKHKSQSSPLLLVTLILVFGSIGCVLGGWRGGGLSEMASETTFLLSFPFPFFTFVFAFAPSPPFRSARELICSSLEAHSPAIDLHVKFLSSCNCCVFVITWCLCACAEDNTAATTHELRPAQRWWKVSTVKPTSSVCDDGTALSDLENWGDFEPVYQV